MRSTIEEAFRVLLGVVIPLAAFTTGLRAPKPVRGDARLWRRPGQLGRDLLAVLILVPIWVIAVVLVLPLSTPVRGGLLVATLAVGIGPVAAMKRMGPDSQGAREALDLNVVVLAISLAFVPLAFAAVAAVFHAGVDIGVGAVAKVVLGRALVPVLLGLGVRRWWPRFAAAAGAPLQKIVTVVLLIVVVAAIAITWKHLAGVGVVGWLACALVAAGAIAIGHLMGGPDSATRGVVAAASVMRFPALALALASVTRQGHRLIPVIIVYALVAFAMLAIYGLFTSRRRHAREAAPPAPRMVPRTT